MPVVLRYKGYRFFFFSNEGEPREPMHIHVRSGDKIAKFWLEPAVLVAENYGFTSKQMTELWDVVVLQQSFFKEKWHEYFSI